MKRVLLLASVVIIPVLVGCASRREGPHQAVAVPAAALEERETAVVLDDILSKKISVEAQSARWTEDRRLQVFANIRNRTDFVKNVDVQTILKEESGFSLGDETAWKREILGPNETKTYTATSLNDRARKYTIRIREGQ